LHITEALRRSTCTTGAKQQRRRKYPDHAISFNSYSTECSTATISDELLPAIATASQSACWIVNEIDRRKNALRAAAIASALAALRGDLEPPQALLYAEQRKRA
jgi:EAL domain-containing protein (putative c-di-GMP-specific phosphodiesterase class I)